ncbi:MAG: phytoene/squalene synthase family protein [Candidatus Limnocylindrus sp.]
MSSPNELPRATHANLASEAFLPEARRTINRVARSFSLAARFLPADRRRDVELLYLVMRSLDDLVDVDVRAGGSSRSAALERIERIREWSRGAAHDQVPRSQDREMIILEDLLARHPSFPRDAVSDFLDGMTADLDAPNIATDDDASRYCYQVAGTVGRMMAALLGVAARNRDAADRAARALGSAMQHTNILRDIDEDLANGRVYIARAALNRCGLDPAAADGPTSLHDGDRRALLREEIARAEAEYVEGISGIRYLQHGGRSIRAAALLYREILRQIERDGLGARRPHRSVVGRARKSLLLIQALISSDGSAARA